mgnify:CR=1 FL=1
MPRSEGGSDVQVVYAEPRGSCSRAVLTCTGNIRIDTTETPKHCMLRSLLEERKIFQIKHCKLSLLMCKQRIQHFQKDHMSDFLKNSGLMRYLNCQILCLLWGKPPIPNMLNYTEDWAVHIKPDLPQTVSDLHKAYLRDCLPFVKRLQFPS